MKKIGRTIRRRRREAKTDYKLRFGLLKSEKQRVVVRKTNRYIIGQIVISDIAQDRVVLSVSSKDLLSYGWPEKLKGSLKSLPACYLTGFLLGKKLEKTREGILDIGLQRNIKNSRIYAFVRGLVDSGFSIPHSEESLPDQKFLEKNELTGKLINQLKEKIL
ncbi:MAG: 50S ribosomal protein L18 [Candidatus Pacearchaeota archaeon]|nr:50S ribosomal protein L18 [Candidatus Pacearchaeota archaeon]